MIKVKYGDVTRLAKAFGVGKSFVSECLRGKYNGERAQKIRKCALSKEYNGQEFIIKPKEAAV